MDCQTYKDEVLLYAAGALTPEEAEPVLRHLASGCPACAGQLAEAEATLSLLAMTLPQQTPSPDLAARLMRRVTREVATATPMKIGPSAPEPEPQPELQLQPQLQRPIPWFMQLMIPSAIAASIAAAVTIFFAVRMENRMAAMTPPAQGADMEKTVGLLTSVVEQEQHELAALKSAPGAQTVEWLAQPNLKIISLAGTAAQPAGASGRIFWDSDHALWHFFADGMKPAPAGKTYELWFVSSDGKTALPAGSFDPAPDGTASLVHEVPPDIAPKLGVGAVTDEPAGGSQTPTGSFQLEGKLN